MVLRFLFFYISTVEVNMGENSIKALMVYYSFEGNVEFIASKVKSFLDLDLERLIPDVEPPRKGLGKFLAGGHSALFNKLPNLAALKHNISDYDQFIIASPVWAGTYTPAIGAFLRDNKIQGKRIYLIASSASGNAEKMLLKLEDALKGNNVVDTLSLQNPLKDPDSASTLIQNFCHRILN